MTREEEQALLGRPYKPRPEGYTPRDTIPADVVRVPQELTFPCFYCGDRGVCRHRSG